MQITQAYCNKCGHFTSHDIIGAEKQEEDCGGRGLLWYDLYEMLKCRGCGNATMRHTSSNVGAQHPTIVYYPPEIARRAPLWVDKLIYRVSVGKDDPVPDHICALMSEVYTAVQNDSRRLAAMGIRAALESVMIEKVGDQRSFNANMDALQKAGYLSVRQALSLNSIFEAGHAAIHRAWEPTNDDIVTLLDIAENIVEVVYLHEHRVRDLDKNVPKRQRPSSREMG